MNLYPVNLDLQNRICLIFGGGTVAARKIGALVSCGAAVSVISPEVLPVIEKRAEAGKITWLRRSYQRGDMDGAFLVFAATGSRTVQQAIVDEAREKSILVNSASQPEACTFQVPAKVRRGKFLLTVSTGGGSPALASKLRKKLEKEYGPEYQQFIELMSYVRGKIISDGNTQESHKAVFEKLLQLDIAAQIRQQDWFALQKELSTILPENMDVDDVMAAIQASSATSSSGQDMPCPCKKQPDSEQ